MGTELSRLKRVLLAVFAEEGQERVILFNLCGHGHFDMAAYDAYFAGKLQDYEYPAEAVAEAQQRMPQIV